MTNDQNCCAILVKMVPAKRVPFETTHVILPNSTLCRICHSKGNVKIRRILTEILNTKLSKIWQNWQNPRLANLSEGPCRRVQISNWDFYISKDRPRHKPQRREAFSNKSVVFETCRRTNKAVPVCDFKNHLFFSSFYQMWHSRRKKAKTNQFLIWQLLVQFRCLELCVSNF